MKRSSREGQRLEQSSSQLDGASTSQIIGSKIQRLQETGTFYKKKIQQEGQKLKQVEEEIIVAEKRLKDLREKLMKARETKVKKIYNKETHSILNENELNETDKCDPIILQNKISAINKKINTQKMKLNESVAKNKYYKDQINFLRQEKEICDDIYHKLEVDLAVTENRLREKKKEAERLKKEKEQNDIEIQKCKTKREHQKKEFEKQFHSVFKILNEENRDQRLEEQGLKKRRNQNDSEADNFLDELEASPNQGKSFYYEDQTATKKKKAVKTQEVSEEDLKEKKKQVEQYQQIFQSLKEETKSNNIDEIVKKFVDYQDENYALFNYINTIRDEYEQLNKEKISLQKQVQQLEKEQKDPQSEKDPKTKKFNELKREIDQVRRRRKRFEDDHDKLKQTINQLKISVPIMFDRIGCNSEEYTRELGGGSFNAKDIEESNMLQILAVIEKRTNDLLQLYSVAYKHGDQKNTKGANDDSQQSFSALRGVNPDKKNEEFLPEPVKKQWALNYDDANERIQKLKEEQADKNKKDLFQQENEKKNNQEVLLKHHEFEGYVYDKVLKKKGEQKNQKK